MGLRASSIYFLGQCQSNSYAVYAVWARLSATFTMCPMFTGIKQSPAIAVLLLQPFWHPWVEISSPWTGDVQNKLIVLLVLGKSEVIPAVTTTNNSSGSHVHLTAADTHVVVVGATWKTSPILCACSLETHESRETTVLNIPKSPSQVI